MLLKNKLKLLSFTFVFLMTTSGYAWTFPWEMSPAEIKEMNELNCGYLPVKSNADEAWKPYYDEDKGFCVIPVQTDAAFTMAFEDSFAVDWNDYFSDYAALVEEVSVVTTELKALSEKVSEYETYFTQISEVQASFAQRRVRAPYIDISVHVAHYNNVVAQLASKLEESAKLSLEFDEVPALIGSSTYHHRGVDYPYYWEKGGKKLVVLLSVPHGKTLKEAKKLFVETTFFNGFTDFWAGLVTMFNDVSPAMYNMKRDMRTMVGLIEKMQLDMSSMPEMSADVKVMSGNMKNMSELMFYLGKDVNKMSGSVGGMSSQMKKPFMGMFSSFMPFM
ncbi:MAG: hypothetical protein HON90_05610 [Halobacteriovoraceae bacterium]|jgi:hypothetical protein|nr:hypothetical protein [Halobacteriovoraceae bacterium]